MYLDPDQATRAKRIPKSYKCPECGANTQFDVSVRRHYLRTLRIHCPVKARLVGLTGSQHEFTLKTLSTANQGWGIERKHMHCESCGAEFSISEDSISSTCPFCAANKVNINPAPVDFLRPEYLIPFKISSENIKFSSMIGCGKGGFIHLIWHQMQFYRKFTGIYLPFWIFDAKINANWRANVNTFDEVYS